MRIVTITAGILSSAGLVVTFLALHDIGNDYISPLMTDHFGLDQTLPEWTACALEWKALQMGLIPMVLFHALFFITVMRRKRNSL